MTRLTVDAIEERFGIKLPARHRMALLNSRDPVHERTVLLKPEGNQLQSIFAVNEFLRATASKRWPEHLIAFATNECGDYFAYDVRHEPFRIYYIDPIGTVAESIAVCENEGFVFAGFDDWYEYTLRKRS